uniref:uncharacterized protein LOC118518301 isoform X1 n=1 Tax=Halichoerus grypus TaxID=9711 RepID=UPI001659F647|nr:uncharacterized protein LOC118518301 isoform X1 [Halichoerus grypus]
MMKSLSKCQGSHTLGNFRESVYKMAFLLQPLKAGGKPPILMGFWLGKFLALRGLSPSLDITDFSIPRTSLQLSSCNILQLFTQCCEGNNQILSVERSFPWVTSESTLPMAWRKTIFRHVSIASYM